MSLATAAVAAINAGLKPGSTGYWAFIRLYSMSN